MNYTKRETFLIWLDSFPHLEYRVKAEIYRMYRGGSAEEFCEKQKPALSALLGERAEAVFGASNGAYAEYVLNALHKKNVSCVTRESAAYPRELAEVPWSAARALRAGEYGTSERRKVFRRRQQKERAARHSQDRGILRKTD